MEDGHGFHLIDTVHTVSTKGSVSELRLVAGSLTSAELGLEWTIDMLENTSLGATYNTKSKKSRRALRVTTSRTNALPTQQLAVMHSCLRALAQSAQSTG